MLDIVPSAYPADLAISPPLARLSLIFIVVLLLLKQLAFPVRLVTRRDIGKMKLKVTDHHQK